MRSFPAAACVAAFLTLPGAVFAEDAAGRLSVTGRASVRLPPELAFVQVGVQTRAGTAAAALAQNSAAVAKVLDALRASGVEARDLATGAVSLSPVYRPAREEPGPRPEAVEAGNTVRVTVRDVARLGGLLARVVDDGANRIDGVLFDLADRARAEADAQGAAVADAFRRATIVADAAGLALGSVESIAAPPRGVQRGGAVTAASTMARAASPSVPIEGGTVEVAAEVDITWGLRRP